MNVVSGRLGVQGDGGAKETMVPRKRCCMRE